MSSTHLVWGVKSSFRQYIARIADGWCELAPGCRAVGGGDFRFDPEDAGVREVGILKFVGGVRFLAHYGALNVALANPWIEERSGRIVLTLSEQLDGADRYMLAELSPLPVTKDAESSAAARFEARLSESGVDVFNGYYEAGTLLDPLSVVS